jgi:tetratricopeptide (TPR) repeat protein
MRALTLLAVLLLLGLGAPVYADDAHDCGGHDDNDARIAACTRLLTGIKEQSLAAYTRAIEVGVTVNISSYHEQRAGIFGLMRRWDRAIEDYTGAIRLRTEDDWFKGRLFQDRGRAYQAKGDLDRAIEDFTTGLTGLKEWFTNLWSRARAYGLKGDWSRAFADIGEAIRLYSHGYKSQLLLERAALYRAKGDWEQAFADYDLAIADDSSSSYVARASARLDRGQLDLALQDADAAVRLDPGGTTGSLWMRARVKAALGKPDDALADLDDSLKFHPTSGDALFHRAAAYEAKGDRDRALAGYTRLLALTRGHADIDGLRDAGYEYPSVLREKARGRIVALGGTVPAEAPVADAVVAGPKPSPPPTVSAGPPPSSEVIAPPKPGAIPLSIGRRVAL